MINSMFNFLLFPVTRSIKIEFTRCYGLCLPTANTAVLCCKLKGGEYRLIEYNLQTGGESRRIEVKEKPKAITQVLVTGRPCIAVSYG